MVQYLFALDWWIGIRWLSAHESSTKGEYSFPHNALLKDPAQTMGLNDSDCTTSEPSLGLVAWLREFCHTLEIITRTLREVVNRVRLCGHHTVRCWCGEVHVDGTVMRRGGEGGDQYCIDSDLQKFLKNRDIKSPDKSPPRL